ncbi:MAG: hotdog domain-containing protein [Actinomycetota bacterium]
MEIQVGTTARVPLVVGEVDTAVALGSGDVPVLGTPRVVALMEEAAVAAVSGALDEGTTSVGTRISVDHLAASAVGATVEARAQVVGVDGRAISFRLSVHESGKLVAKGTHTRFVVDRQAFLGS